MLETRSNTLIINWKTWALCIILVLLLPCLVFAAAPDLSVSSVSGSVGNTVAVSVNADFNIPVNSIQFTISYDQTLLTVSSVTTGAANASWYIVNNPVTYTNPATLTVGMFNQGGSTSTLCNELQAGLCSFQQIAVIYFTVKARSPVTSSPLTISNPIFDNNCGPTSPCPPSLTSGNFSLSAAPINGVCGTAGMTYLYNVTTFGSNSLCKTGNSNPVTVAFPSPGSIVRWTCVGINGGFNSACKAQRNSRTIIKL